MISDFAYYYIQYKTGKIINLVKSDSPIDTTMTDGIITMGVTANEYNLFKAVDRDIEFARQIVDDWEQLLNYTSKE
jgi:hypothetical protein